MGEPDTFGILIRYGWNLWSIASTALYTAAWTMARSSMALGPGRGGTAVVNAACTAMAFQSATASAQTPEGMRFEYTSTAAKLMIRGEKIAGIAPPIDAADSAQNYSRYESVSRGQSGKVWWIEPGERRRVRRFNSTGP